MKSRKSTPEITPKELKAMIQEIVPEIRELRRHLHTYPELGLEEYETAALIRKELASTKAEILPPYLETDTTALIYGTRSAQDTDDAVDGKVKHILLRADIDALAVIDECGNPWQSRNPGVSHSCGHDGHTAILIGTARILDKLADRFTGSVRFVFQPAEEQLGGGQKLVEQGLMEADPIPEAAYALHGWPEVPIGSFAACPGIAMAASDGFQITVRGKGGHGAKPHLSVNPIIPAANIVHMIEEALTQSIDPLLPAVISVCQLHAGKTDNVIPETAELSGTIRYYDQELKDVIETRLDQIAHGCCLAAGADYDFRYRKGYIPLVNDIYETAHVEKTIKKWMGVKAWHRELGMTTSSEDFSFYLDKVPGVFIRLGLGDNGINLHNPRFDFNDDAIIHGIHAMCALVLERLGQGLDSK